MKIQLLLKVIHTQDLWRKPDLSGDEEKKEIQGYRQQPGKLPFSKPGSGGKGSFSKPIDLENIPISQNGKKDQPWGPHRHDSLISGQVIGKSTALVDSSWKVTGQAQYGDDIRLPNELITLSDSHYINNLKLVNNWYIKQLIVMIVNSILQ